MASIGKERAFVREIDQRTDELLMRLSTAAFKPDLVIGSSRSGSVLGRILACKIGCSFLGYPFSCDGIREKVFSSNCSILFVDDSPGGGSVEALVETVRALRPEMDARAIIGAFFRSLQDYVMEAFEKEPSNLSYTRRWKFHRETLRQMVGVKTAEELIDSLVSSAEKSFGKDVDIGEYVKAAEKDVKSLHLDVFFQMIARNMLGREHTPLKAFKNLGVYFMEWPQSFPGLPWSSRSTRDGAAYFIRRSDQPWGDAAADEIKKQYSEYSPMPRFYMSYPFNERIGGINDPETRVIGAVYEFMVIDESRTLPEAFVSWLEEKGYRFYRKTDREGSFLLETTRMTSCLQYSIKSHKDFYILEFRTDGASPVRCFEGCARGGTCKVKAEARDDAECLLCNNFKTTFSALFGADKPGFFQWLDRKGVVTNAEFWVYLDGIKVESLSKIDLYEHMKEFHQW